MNREQTGRGLAVPDLAWAARTVLARAGRPLPLALDGEVVMPVRYMRRRPAEGLHVIYDSDPGMASGRGMDDRSSRYQPVSVKTMKAWAWGAARLVSVAVGERSLEGMRTRFDTDAVLSAGFEIQPSGRVYSAALDLAVDVFPVDLGMPALATCFDPVEGGLLWEGLQSAARLQLGGEGWRLREISAEPIRYKPGDRCVLLFHLLLDKHSEGQGSPQPVTQLTVVGKLHAEPEQARFNYMVQERLYRDRDASLGGRAGQGEYSPIVPRPLGFIDQFGLTVSEAVATEEANAGAAAEDELDRGQRGRRGEVSNPWSPRVIRGSGGRIAGVIPPEMELRRAAESLARLHHREAATYEVPERPSSIEMEDVRHRAARIAAGNPAQADFVLELGERVAERLDGLQPLARRLVHGSFKPSQLLFQGGETRVIDWDELVVADPALDVGSFLAWLRPGGLWYGRPGSRAWFDASAEEFVRAYGTSMAALTDDAEILRILERARPYEASKLFKIAVRRVRYQNSPRPGELAAMCQEISDCLEQGSRWKEVLAG